MKTDIQATAAKYGWTALSDLKETLYTLINRKGNEACKLELTGAKYRIIGNVGQKLLSGNQDAAQGLEKVMKEYFYCNEVKPVTA